MIEREFTQDDQRRFARLSGDWNPMHVDAVEARRTPYGQLVHGVHVVMWALEQHLEGASAMPQRIRATFLQPVRPSAPVDLSVASDGDDFVITVRGQERALVTIRLSGTPLSTAMTGGEDVPEAAYPVSRPRASAFADARGLEGHLDLCADHLGLSIAFPYCVRALGARRVSSLLALSRLVGMECPGLHSVFAGLDVSFNAAPGAVLSYRVARHLTPAAPIRLSVSGGGIEGTIDAFFRPAPVAQLTATEARALVEPAEFAGETALIVGGSRGLGEASAKLIAAGGGRVIVTFHAGAADAQRVADEISSAGERCQVAPLDILGSLDDLRDVTSGERFTQVLFFASPAIRTNRGGTFDRPLFDAYAAYYVEGFSRLCRALPAADAIRVFYPSTVFVSEAPAGFLEYAAAKAAGETVAAALAAERPSLSFVVDRLPRARTDQTSSLLDHGGLSAHDVMLPILRRMSSYKEHA